jgi:hypothetical protein
MQKQRRSNWVPIFSMLLPMFPYIFKGLDAIPKGFPSLPEDLKNKIIHLKMRSSKEEVEDIIARLCSLGSLQPVQMGKILGRDAQYLRIKFLSEMVKTGKLIDHHPDKPAHPQQAYKVPEIREVKKRYSNRGQD